MSFKKLLLGFFLIPICAESQSASDQWVLGQYEVDGMPVVMKVLEEMPKPSTRERLPWLTVITWLYDATENNGMPNAQDNSGMIKLEDAIDSMEARGICMQVYSKTGNGRKELVYYIADRDKFISALNDTLAEHPRYPLDIEFFEDPEWTDLQTVHKVYLGK